MILADTSIWIELFRKGHLKRELEELIDKEQLCIHPFVIGELACGYLPDRKKTLASFGVLISLPTIKLDDVLAMVEARNLWGKGIGLTDAQLIASCLASTGTHIWTIDNALGRIAASIGILYQP